MAGVKVQKALNVIAMTFVAMFAGIWLWIAWKVARYIPTDTAKTYPMSGPLGTTAGFLAATVGAGTASVLGITIAETKGRTQNTFGARLADAGKDSPLLITGILVYFFVGIAILLVWLANPNEAPDAINVFALGVLGWAGGAFTAVFKAPSQ